MRRDGGGERGLDLGGRQRRLLLCHPHEPLSPVARVLEGIESILFYSVETKVGCGIHATLDNNCVPKTISISLSEKKVVLASFSMIIVLLKSTIISIRVPEKLESKTHLVPDSRGVLSASLHPLGCSVFRTPKL